MRDLIERQAAIDVCYFFIDLWRGQLGEGITIAIKKRIAELPPAQPEQRWIPVSERLPKIDESVLVTTDWDDLSIAWRIGVNEWYIHEGNTNSTTDDITAWMPLPEPYRAERRTDE